jgi:hypothetical protein
MKALRITLVVVGTLVWVPYALFKYALHDPFPVWWVLVIHVPCMLGALALRIWGWGKGGTRSKELKVNSEK